MCFSRNTPERKNSAGTLSLIIQFFVTLSQRFECSLAIDQISPADVRQYETTPCTPYKKRSESFFEPRKRPTDSGCGLSKVLRCFGQSVMCHFTWRAATSIFWKTRRNIQKPNRAL
jgi:hypothetical protein